MYRPKAVKDTEHTIYLRYGMNTMHVRIADGRFLMQEAARVEELVREVLSAGPDESTVGTGSPTDSLVVDLILLVADVDTVIRDHLELDPSRLQVLLKYLFYLFAIGKLHLVRFRDEETLPRHSRLDFDQILGLVPVTIKRLRSHGRNEAMYAAINEELSSLFGRLGLRSGWLGERSARSPVQWAPLPTDR